MLIFSKLCSCISLNHRLLVSLLPVIRGNYSLVSVPEVIWSYDSPIGWDRAFFSEALKISAKACSILGGKQLHAGTVKLGLCDVLSLQNQILDVYVKCRQHNAAWRLFGEMHVRNVVTWNTLICGLVDFSNNGEYDSRIIFSALRLMKLESVNPDFLTFTGLLRASVKYKDMGIVTQLHCFVIKFGFLENCFVSNSLINIYGKLDAIRYARLVFNEANYRDLAVWNAILSCHSSETYAGEAFRIYSLMHLEGFTGDEFTFSKLINTCAAPGFLQAGKQIHGLIIKFSFAIDILVSSTLIDMYAKNGIVDDAQRTFDEMPCRNLVSWNTIIMCYGRQGNGREAMRFFREMLQKDMCPNELTLSNILTSCGNVSATSESHQLHAYLVKSRLNSFLSTANALIYAYSKCGSIESASQCFSAVSEPDLVTWTSIICAYGFHGLANESCEMFEKMVSHGIMPDKVSFLGVLSACSHAGLVHLGLQYFNLMTSTYQIIPDSEHYACLIDLAGRSGFLEQAYEVLKSMPDFDPSAVGAFIGACKVHENSEFAEEAIERLLCLEPNKPVNYALLSNMYAFEGQWVNVARVRKLMRENCENKVPGCSWTEIYGDVHTFVSSDKYHWRSSQLYDILEMFLWEVKECSTFLSNSDIWLL
ncbi:hypothetical protein SAY87_015030 [Trapa incisa]|uniref:Pentatricopeptide repeat-containing protein n=1 Tax=Trapa incisa TaxID=236973 RepID=A0AAN7GTL0_9MYRT|nr:hypothetical protein SAY87_015030 [Trapa incisa]